MKHVISGAVVAAMLLLGTASVWAHEGMQEEATENTGQEQTLTGEVVDVFCYLSHGKEGLGQGHAGCARHCIENGLPVAIKVGDQLYLASMANHEAANKTLVQYAGEQVTVSGKVMERDGQHLIAISSVRKAD